MNAKQKQDHKNKQKHISVAIWLKHVVCSTSPFAMEPHEQFLDIAGPGEAFAKHADRDIAKHCEVFKDFLTNRARCWVEERTEEPIQEIFQSDGTPVTTTERTADAWEEFKVVRRGRQTEEYLIQRLWLNDTHSNVCPVFGEPRLMADKTADTHYKGYAEMWPGAREMGARACVHKHFVFDDAVKSAIAHRIKQNNAAYEYMLAEEFPETAALLILWTWITIVNCKAHVFHNALKWAMLIQMTTKSLMRDCWIVLASLRNSFEQLVEDLPDWILARIRYMDWDAGVCRDTWETFGLEGAWLLYFLDLQIRFQDGFLYVAVKFETDGHALQKVKVAILFLWKFRRWTEARWLGMGRCCRQLFSCLFLGLEDLVHGILSRKKSHKYHLSGFNRLNDKIKRMLAVVTCTSRVSEKPLALLLKDNRLALTLPAVDQAIDTWSKKATDLPEHTLEVLALTAGMSTTELRDGNFHSVETQVAYARHGLLEARGLPWSLARGDVVHNLRTLKAGPKPVEEVAGRIWDLMDLGETPESLTPTVYLLAQVPWTTKAVEDPHAVANAIMRANKAKGRDTVMPIAVLRQASPLFRRNPDELKLERLQGKIDSVRRRQVWKINGRHVFCKALVEVARDEGASGNVVAQGFSRRVIQFHGKRWEAMHPTRRARYRTDAVALQQVKREANLKELHSLLEKLRAAKLQFEENALEGRSIDLLDRCRFSEAALCDYDDFFEKSEYKQDFVDERRAKARVPLRPPLQQELATLDIFKGNAKPPPTQRPVWTAWMAYNRDVFTTCVVRFTKGDECRHFKFAYASQQPLNVAMHKANVVEDYEPLLEADRQEEQDLTVWTHSFDVDLTQPYYTDAGDFDDLGDVHILTDVHKRVTGYLATDSDYNTLGEMMAKLPENVRDGAEAQSREKDNIVQPEPWMMDPYMWEFVKEGGDLGDPGKTSPKFRTVVDHYDSSDDSSEDDDLLDEMDAMDQLLERREVLDSERGEDLDVFWWCLRGGPWTARVRGVAYDAYAAMARGKDARAFCVHYGTTV